MSEEIYIVDGIRTAVGNFNGSLASLPAHKLGEVVIRALLERNKLDPSLVSEVILGQVLTGGCGQNPPRQASVNSGIPVEVPAWNVNQVCGSGLKAVMLGCQSIMAGNADIVIAGGQESMSQCAHSIHMRNGTKMGDAKLVDMMVFDGLTDAFSLQHMGITAENIAKKFNITREDQDKLALASQNKAEAAQKAGKFKEEITPVKIVTRKGETIVDSDEFPRHGTNIEALSSLKPAFMKEGTVTAGNASGINDGAAGLLLMKKSVMEKLGLKPMVKVLGFAQAGVQPEIMGTGPIAAVKKLLEKTGLKVSDFDLIEANEAFAAQAISVDRELGWDMSKVNVNGGAIAIGHPIGASGARVLVTLLYEMKKRSSNKGLATLCIGGGMGVAMAVESV